MAAQLLRTERITFDRWQQHRSSLESVSDFSSSLSDEERTMPKVCVDDLIPAVQRRTVLWSDTHKDFKTKSITDKHWNEVGLICNCTGTAAKAKWKNLKDTFRRTMQKLPQQSGSEAQPANIKWPYLEQMAFLKRPTVPEPADTKFVISRKKKTNVESEILEIEKKRLKILKHQIGKEEIEKPEKPKDNENEDLLFFKSLLPIMHNFSDLEKLEIRNEIQNIIIAKLRNKE